MPHLSDTARKLRADFKLFIDFDSTLYDTSGFARHLWEVVASKAGISAERVAADADAFYADPVLGGYDYPAHIAVYGLDTGTMWRKLDAIADETDYLYDDSAAFIRQLRDDGFDPEILSFGEARFQVAKIKPVLGTLAGNSAQPLRFETVMRPKALHLASLYPGARGALVDDKADQRLPPGFAEVHLHRAAGLLAPRQTDAVYMVSSLAQARDVLLRHVRRLDMIDC